MGNRDLIIKKAIGVFSASAVCHELLLRLNDYLSIGFGTLDLKTVRPDKTHMPIEAEYYLHK